MSQLIIIEQNKLTACAWMMLSPYSYPCAANDCEMHTYSESKYTYMPIYIVQAQHTMVMQCNIL